ncbi:GNAT family N-acetyltransferase [Paenibacillus aestuarii]|uniref:GNAT family N-acetyltransferase n=1 Tax=Paenibacillus aestuarii TaxID=516965 RepID=A0ABW0KHS7_9BACL|nr:GNAT family protein [Paenibacillus aestuarii]
MNYRVLEEADAAAYRQVRLSALQINPEAFGSTYEREFQFTLEMVMERIKPTAEKFTLGAFQEDGTLVGIAAFVRETGFKTAHKGNIYGMFIAPEARGGGVGKALLLELIRLAKETAAGLEQIHLSVVSENAGAKKLYASLGFEVYGVERHALKVNGLYYDEDLMLLML